MGVIFFIRMHTHVRKRVNNHEIHGVQEIEISLIKNMLCLCQCNIFFISGTLRSWNAQMWQQNTNAERKKERKYNICSVANIQAHIAVTSAWYRLRFFFGYVHVRANVCELKTCISMFLHVHNLSYSFHCYNYIVMVRQLRAHVCVRAYKHANNVSNKLHLGDSIPSIGRFKKNYGQ